MTKRKFSRSQSQRSRTRRDRSKLGRDAQRQLSHETLERRELLAVGIGPRLISVNPNAGDILNQFGDNELTSAPRELTFRFTESIDSSTLDNIRLFAAGDDDEFVDDETQIVPGFLGLGDSDRSVVMRFNNTLDDDRYRIEITDALLDTDGEAFGTALGDMVQTLEFDVEIGGKVIAVVPQPIVSASGVLTRSDS
ncbi:MAG: hypothetical protein AAGA03_14750, partial [Planctomycetota bacterium]